MKTNSSVAVRHHDYDAPPVLQAASLTASLARGAMADLKDLTRKVVAISPDQLSQTEQFELLIDRVAKHQDRAAFARLFDYFAPRLKTFLLKKGLNEEAAEDVMMDAMTNVWRKAHLYDAKKAALTTWVFRIARNRFIDIKRKFRHVEVDADDHMAQMVAPEESDAQLKLSQDQELVGQAMKTLNAEQKEVIELSFFEDLSHSMIAERLGLPLGTVKSRIRLAFKAMKKQLEPVS